MLSYPGVLPALIQRQMRKKKKEKGTKKKFKALFINT